MAEHANLYRRAFYYDIALERDVSKEVDFIITAYRHYVGRELQSVLDLACGPGYHARSLAAKGLHATGVDLSKEMLELAEKKSGKEGLNIRWINADMRSFRLKNPVDLAICMFDSFDALLTNDDIVQNFRCIAENINPGGLYLIDLTHLREVDYNHYGEFRYCGERNGIKVEIVWATNNPQYDLVTGIAPVAIEIHVEDNGEKFVVHDTAKERLVDPQELILFAELSGAFDVAGWHGDYDLKQPLDHSADSQRMICVLKERS